MVDAILPDGPTHKPPSPPAALLHPLQLRRLVDDPLLAPVTPLHLLSPLHPLQLRRLVDDPLLAGTSHVVVDEVREALLSPLA